MDIDIEANIAAANEATRQLHYVKLRQYIGFLQMTIAVAWMPAAQKTEGA